MSEQNIFELNEEQLGEVTGGKEQKVMATQGGVNVRSGPGTSFGVVAKTQKGSIATYTGEARVVEGKLWICVKWSGKMGWICEDYVKKI